MSVGTRWGASPEEGYVGKEDKDTGLQGGKLSQEQSGGGRESTRNFGLWGQQRKLTVMKLPSALLNFSVLGVFFLLVCAEELAMEGKQGLALEATIKSGSGSESTGGLFLPKKKGIVKKILFMLWMVLFPCMILGAIYAIYKVWRKGNEAISIACLGDSYTVHSFGAFCAILQGEQGSLTKTHKMLT